MYCPHCGFNCRSEWLTCPRCHKQLPGLASGDPTPPPARATRAPQQNRWSPFALLAGVAAILAVTLLLRSC